MYNIHVLMDIKSKVLTSQKSTPKTDCFAYLLSLLSPLIPTCALARLSPCLSFLVEVSDATKRSVRLNCVTMVASSALTQGGDPSTNKASLGQDLSGPNLGFLSGLLLISKAGTNGK